jgi:hypothetical protein
VGTPIEEPLDGLEVAVGMRIRSCSLLEEFENKV